MGEFPARWIRACGAFALLGNSRTTDTVAAGVRESSPMGEGPRPAFALMGRWSEPGRGRAEFCEHDEVSDGDVAGLVFAIRARVLRYLRRAGKLPARKFSTNS